MKKILLLTLIFLLIFVFAFHFKEEILKNEAVKIFIIDSEVETGFLSSPALKINPDSSHGSKVAAVIRSQSRADIKAFSAENIIGKIDEDNYLNALSEIKNYAAVHPQEKIIVNISLGFEKAEFQEEIIKKINKLDNIILIAASGNNNSENISYPAKFDNVIAVAALETGRKMPGSNYGQEIDFSASGIIEVTQRHYLPAFNFSRKYKITGTSFAAPQLTALTADILSLNSNLKIEDALKIMVETAKKIDDPLFKEEKLGAGSINRFKALTKANPYYFWLQLAVYSSLITAAFLLLYFCWQKYSLSGIFIFITISTIVFLMQPFLLLIYYQFGLQKIILFLLSLTLLYSLFLKLITFYLKKTDNYSLLLKLAPYLNNNLRVRLNNKIKSILTQKNEKQIEKLEKIIISNLRKSNSQKKISFYLKLAAALNNPPVKLIVEKSLNYRIGVKEIASNFNLSERNKTQQAFIIAELLTIIFNDDYLHQKKTAEVLAELKNPLILIPIKNTLKKRKLFKVSFLTQYFLLDIVGAFAVNAEDFSLLLKEIITQENDPWLKYHALQAYQKAGINDIDYQNFIKEIKAKEKEPVLLALEN